MTKTAQTTKTKTTGTETGAERQAQTFSDLLRNYERQAKDRQTTGTDTADFTKALDELGQAVTFSVLKKVIDPQRKGQDRTHTHTDHTGQTHTYTAGSDTGYNKELVQMKSALYRDLKHLDTVRRTGADGDGTDYTYTAEGDIEKTITDKAQHDTAKDVEKADSTYTLSDCMDLYNSAILAILTETQRQAQTADGLTLDGWLEKVYTVRELKRKVYIQTADSVGAWTDTETTPIQQIYKAVRRVIADSRAVSLDPRSKYVYLSDIAKDTETDTETEIYKRLPKYSQAVSVNMHVDRNGNCTMTATTDEHSTADTEAVISALNLSAQQAQILQYRLKGYGVKAIATALGCKVQPVQNQLKRIQAKAQKIGLDPQTAHTDR